MGGFGGTFRHIWVEWEMTIRPRRNPSGKIVYQLDLGEGPGSRRTFKKKGDAQRAMDDELDKRERHGRMADGISAQEMAEMVTVFHRLRAAGASVSEAADFYLAHARRLREPLALREVMERFREDRERLGLSGKYVSQLKVPFGSLARLFPSALAHELTVQDIQRWIRLDPRWGPKTQSNYLGDVSAMFEWALLPAQGYVRMNPCVGIERAPPKRRGIVSTLTLEQAEQMLRAALEREDWRVMTYLVLSLLGGIRPEESTYQGLVWADIHLEEKTVRLSEEVVKTGAGRVVDLTENAVAWLKRVPMGLREGPVVLRTNWQERWRRFRYDLGWRVATEKEIRKYCYPPVEAVHGEWPKDVLRHTFASMHYAEHSNEHLLQVQMGHRSPKMIHAHYRAVKTRKEAAVFWGLKPE